MVFKENTDEFPGGVSRVCPFQGGVIAIKIETPLPNYIQARVGKDIRNLPGNSFKIEQERIGGGKCNTTYDIELLVNRDRYFINITDGKRNSLVTNEDASLFARVEGAIGDCSLSPYLGLGEAGNGEVYINFLDGREKQTIASSPIYSYLSCFITKVTRLDGKSLEEDIQECGGKPKWNVITYDCEGNKQSETSFFTQERPKVIIQASQGYKEPKRLFFPAKLFGYLEFEKTIENNTYCTITYVVYPFSSFERPNNDLTRAESRIQIRKDCSPICVEKHPRIYWDCTGEGDINPPPEQPPKEPPKEPIKKCPSNTCYEETINGIKYCYDECCNVISRIKI